MIRKPSKTNPTLLLAAFSQFCLEFVVGQFQTMPEPQFNIVVTNLPGRTSKLVFAAIHTFVWNLFDEKIESCLSCSPSKFDCGFSKATSEMP